jgi:hypothetical protein
VNLSKEMSLSLFYKWMERQRNILVDPGDAVATISKRRLDELETLERQLPYLLKNIEIAQKSERLRLLRERDRADINLVRARVRRYAEKHREVINARRRQRREVNTVIPASAEPAASLLVPVKPAEEDRETSGPRPENGNPENGDVGPSAISPIALNDSGDKKADASHPKHKTRPKKVDE